MSTHSPGESDAAVLENLFFLVGNNYTTQYGNFTSTGPFNPTLATRYDTFAVTLAIILYIILTPFVVVFGVSGNFLSVFVFYTSKLQFQSTSQYLSALAISDSLFLLTLLPPWLSAIKVTGLFHRKGFCQSFVYVTYVTSCLSAWLVIAFTFERFVAVQYPLQRTSFCSVTRARYIISAMTTLSLLVNSPILFFSGPGDDGCNIDREKLIHAARFNWVDTTVTFAIPTLLILFLNLWIVYGVQKLEKTRMQLVKQDTPPPGKGVTRRLSCPRAQQRVTKMLLLVSSVYVILNLPAYTMRLLGYAYDMNSAAMNNPWLSAIHYISTFMFNVNFGINFFLYCLSGQNFRRALAEACPFLACIARPDPAAQNTTNRGRTQSLETSAASNGTENYGLTSGLPSRRPFVCRWNRSEAQLRSRAERPTEEIELTEVVTRPVQLSTVVERRPGRAGGM